MNALYNHGMKQITTLKRDLDKFESSSVPPVSLQGSISTSSIALEKTIKDFEALFNQSSKEDKFMKKLEFLKDSSLEYKQRFEQLKSSKTSVQRDALLGENPYGMNRRHVGGSNHEPVASDGLPMSKFDGLQKEQSILARGNEHLDMILEQAGISLDDIVEQNATLRRLQGTMSKSLATLGASQETINMINKRLFKDKLIFWIGLILMFLGFYLVLSYL